MRWNRVLCLTVIAILSVCFLAGQYSTSAQQFQSTEENSRKVKTKVVPVYPALAQKLHLAGKVRLELLVEPDGHVKTVKVLGGHPVLADAASEAVKGWKYMPSSASTTETVVFDFKPPNEN
jgi:TonB family protein